MPQPRNSNDSSHGRPVVAHGSASPGWSVADQVHTPLRKLPTRRAIEVLTPRAQIGIKGASPRIQEASQEASGCSIKAQWCWRSVSLQKSLLVAVGPSWLAAALSQEEKAITQHPASLQKASESLERVVSDARAKPRVSGSVPRTRGLGGACAVTQRRGRSGFLPVWVWLLVWGGNTHVPATHTPRTSCSDTGPFRLRPVDDPNGAVISTGQVGGSTQFFSVLARTVVTFGAPLPSDPIGSNLISAARKNSHNDDKSKYLKPR